MTSNGDHKKGGAEGYTRSVFLVGTSRFRSEHVCITARAQDDLPEGDVLNALFRHFRCDWGDISPNDWKQNDEAMSERERLFSSYQAGNGTKFWIITDAGWSVTTVLLPSDY